MTGRATAGVVLTGGRSERMGADKALLAIDGRPMAVRVADALREAGCQPVWCQGGDVAALSTLGLDVVADEAPGEGPVGAILSAVRHGGVDVVVAACDLVDVDAATVGAVIGAADTRGTIDVVVARADGRAHLLSWWSASAEARLAELFAAGVRSYREALASMNVIDIDVPAWSVRNANRPDDLVG